VTVRKLLSVFNPRFRVWARDIGISVIASLIIVTVLYQPVRVEGTSNAARTAATRTASSSQIPSSASRKISRGERRRLSTTHAIPKRATSSASSPCPGDSIFIDHGRVWVQ